MSFWTSMAAFAANREAARVERYKRAEAKRSTRLDRPVTYAGLRNVTDTMPVEITERISNRLAAMLSDHIKVLVDHSNEKSEQQIEWVNSGFKLFDNMILDSLKGTADALMGFIDLRFDKVHKEHSAFVEISSRRNTNIVNMLVGSLNQAREYKEQILQSIMEADKRAEYRHEVMMNSLGGLVHQMFKMHTETLDGMTATAKAVTAAAPERGDAPTVEWLLDNRDELVRFAKALSNLEYNDAPAEHAGVAAVASLKNMLPNVTLAEARDAIADRAIKWGVAA